MKKIKKECEEVSDDTPKVLLPPSPCAEFVTETAQQVRTQHTRSCYLQVSVPT